MFGEKDRALKVVGSSTTTILDKGCQFEGKLTFEGSVQIDGKFKGEIFSEGQLVIGEGAVVEGVFEVDSMIIGGQVNGTIKAKRRIEMHSPAVVHGDITAPSLVIQDGAIFEGNCSMGKRSEKVTPLHSVNEYSKSL